MENIKSNSLRVFMMLVGVLTFSLVSAQPQGGGQQGPPPAPTTKQITKMVTELADEINLTEEQQTNVLALYKSHFKEVESKMSSGSRPSRTAMEKMKTTFETKVKAVLTTEQKKKYAAYMKKQESNRPKRS